MHNAKAELLKSRSQYIVRSCLHAESKNSGLDGLQLRSTAQEVNFSSWSKSGMRCKLVGSLSEQMKRLVCFRFDADFYSCFFNPTVINQEFETATSGRRVCVN